MSQELTASSSRVEENIGFWNGSRKDPVCYNLWIRRTCPRRKKSIFTDIEAAVTIRSIAQYFYLYETLRKTTSPIMQNQMSLKTAKSKRGAWKNLIGDAKNARIMA